MNIPAYLPTTKVELSAETPQSELVTEESLQIATINVFFLAMILHVTVVFEALSAVENIRREDAGARYIGYYKVDTVLQTTWQNIYTIVEAKHPISMKINSIRIPASR